MIGIIGDKGISRFDPNLANELNKKFEDQERRERLEGKIQPPELNSPKKEQTLEGKFITFDFETCNTIPRNQAEWMTYFNQEGKIMISAIEIYSFAKEKGFVDDIRKLFNSEQKLITSTNVQYNPDGSGEIIHYNHSNIISPIKIQIPELPDYRGKKLSEAIKDPLWVNYLQNLFYTNDDADGIYINLAQLAGKTIDRIRLWTRDPTTPRKAYPYMRALWIGNGGAMGDFRISAAAKMDGNKSFSVGIRQ